MIMMITDIVIEEDIIEEGIMIMIEGMTVLIVAMTDMVMIQDTQKGDLTLDRDPTQGQDRPNKPFKIQCE